MAKRRTPEEMKQIYINCARILRDEGEAGVLAYLEDTEHYVTPKATWFNISRNEQFISIKKNPKTYEDKEEKEMPKKTEEVVVRDGVTFTKEQDPEDTKKPMIIPDELSRWPGNKEPEEKKEESLIEQVKKPPLGLMPRYVWDLKRQEAILQAMHRYSVAEKAIPVDWIYELTDLMQINKVIFVEGDSDGSTKID